MIVELVFILSFLELLFNTFLTIFLKTPDKIKKYVKIAQIRVEIFTSMW